MGVGGRSVVVVVVAAGHATRNPSSDVRARRTSRKIQRIAYDRWVRGLAILAAVAACGTPDGLTIEVIVDDPSITSVELWLGDHCRSDCPRGVVPPDLTPMPVTQAYTVIDRVPWIVTKDKFEDGYAGFVIESPVDATLPILFIAAYADNQIKWSATFYNVDVPDHDTKHWRVHLLPTTPVETAPAPPNTERVKHWNRPDRPACLLVEHWSDRVDPIRDLLGPADDPDCDLAIDDADCAPWTANAVGFPPTLETANCVLSETQGTGTRCVIAGPECTQGLQNPGGGCFPLPEPYCTPGSFCQCAGSLDPTLDCLKRHIADGTNVGSLPYAKCVIRIKEDGSSCDGSTPIPLSMQRLLGLNDLRHCTAIRVNELTIPFGAFDQSVEIDATSLLKLGEFTAPCDTTVHFDGTSMQKLVHGLVEVELDNAHHLVVPLKIEIKADCTQSSMCGVFGPDDSSLQSCMTSSPPATCEPDPNTNCGGPPCGSAGNCCKAGEHCSNGVCLCGDSQIKCETGNVCVNISGDASLCGNLCCGKTEPCPVPMPP